MNASFWFFNETLSVLRLSGTRSSQLFTMEETQGNKPDAKHKTKLNAAVAFLGLTCLVLFSAVLILSVGESGSSNETPVTYKLCTSSTSSQVTVSTSEDLFRDLSQEEIIRVRDYVLNEPSLNVTPYSEASIASNYIFLIELKNPDKDEALSYLDAGGKKPTRLANVVIFRGAVSPPIVEEILVPVDEPKNHTTFSPGRKNPIPFHYRPPSSIDSMAAQNVIDNFTRRVSGIMWESFKMNCSKSCVYWAQSAPGNKHKSGIRQSWVRLHRPVVGFYLHPLPLEVLIKMNGSDVMKWKVENVFYNNAVFESVESFVSAYESGNITKVSQVAPVGEGLSYSSLNRRGDIKPSSTEREPKQYEPDGKRYTAENNHVEYMGWSFDFRMRTSSGPQLFDIRFNSSRIIYELSLQEAAAFYGGFSPMPTYSDFLDSARALGRSYELVTGVDCPVTATYFDVIAFVDSGKVTRRRNAICVFELNQGMPLRRHYEVGVQGSYAFYGGLSSTALVFRTIITPYNYDYVYDHIFYPNGVVEVKAMTSGYIWSSYWTPEERRFSTRVQKDVAGSTHDHLFHFKVDLDVVGRQNSFEVITSKVNRTNRWSPSGVFHYERYLKRDHKQREEAAAYTYDFETPSYLNFYNEAAKNAHGVRRGYRIQLNGIINQVYPKDWPYTRGLRWTYHQVAVTKYNARQTRSSSIYNQMDFFDPMVDFGQFIDDNEDITNQDLVSWVTVGVMHLPHSEDIPTTATAGNSAGFFLRPFNYFDEDPSIASRDGVVITPIGDASKVERSARRTSTPCAPRDDPIVYSGRVNEL